LTTLKEGDAFGAAKRISARNDVDFDFKRQDDGWGKFDEDWSFSVHEVPPEFRTSKKYENFILAKQEEKEQKFILKSKPYHIEIEPTNICNLRCPLCSTGVDAITRPKQKLKLENFKKLIDEIKDTSRYSIPFFLHPNPDWIIETLASCIDEENPNLYTESILSNDFLQQRLYEIKLL